jgi:hypothetical protein
MIHIARTVVLLVMLAVASALTYAPATGVAAGSAKLEVTLRGCNKGVDPRVGNPATTCTTPLDAPDEAGAVWGGDGQGGMPFEDMDRHYDGTYEVSIPAGQDVELINMFPSLRNAYIVPELDLEVNAPYNSPPVVNAGAGETVSLHFYYFYYPETSATLTILMRGCPEGFDPDVDDFFADCTTPLDAPDASFIYWGGDGQGGMEITALDRQYNGAYVYHASTFTMTVEISGLAPVVRNAYQVLGFNSVSGETYTFTLADGETRQVFVFYYNE